MVSLATLHSLVAHNKFNRVHIRHAHKLPIPCGALVTKNGHAITKNYTTSNNTMSTSAFLLSHMYRATDITPVTILAELHICNFKSIDW